MFDNKDLEKIIKAMADIFPTAKMMNDSFEKVATKEQVEKIEDQVKKMDDRLGKVEAKLDEIEVKISDPQSLEKRVRVLEKALEI